MGEKAIECDQVLNGTLPGSVGTFEAYLRSLPPAIGLGFGGYGEWSKGVDTLIGKLAEIRYRLSPLAPVSENPMFQGFPITSRGHTANRYGPA